MYLVENPVDSGESALCFSVDSIVGLVVELERTAFEDVFRLADIRQRQFRQSGEVHLFDHRPRVLDLRMQGVNCL